MFKVNKNTNTTSMTSFWCFYCYLWTYFTPFSSVSIVKFDQVKIFCDEPVTTCLVCEISGINHPRDFWKFCNCPRFTRSISKFSEIHFIPNHDSFITRTIFAKTLHSRCMTGSYVQLWQWCIQSPVKHLTSSV